MSTVPCRGSIVEVVIGRVGAAVVRAEPVHVNLLTHLPVGPGEGQFDMTKCVKPLGHLATSSTK